MRKSTLAAGAAAVLAVLTAGSALAQQAPRAVRADADGDGRISRAEFVDGRIARLTAIDANRDGSISAEERQSGIDTRRNQRASARFETLDKDGNGAVSREEFTAAREMRGERAGHGVRQGGHRGPGAGWGRGRGHGGGERGQGAEARAPLTIAAVQTRLTARFDRLDANHDGFITAEERTAARQAMRDQRGEGRGGRMGRRGPAQQSPSAPASE
ncbi:EF-hand domain-containing protein [Brevundimonas sp.]|uniref:EF-hand domain-containing protein n=1 Tax=Brevundimonas sp. TaxID=1871086 RepID=UPI003D0D2885